MFQDLNYSIEVMNQNGIPQGLNYYDEVLCIEYDPDENCFYDDDGYLIYNIFDMITPSDLVLFRFDYDFNTFVHRHDKTTLCLINIRGEQEEDYG